MQERFDCIQNTGFCGRGGLALPYKEANEGVPLDGVAFSRLD